MIYLDETDENISQDIIYRKEFQLYKSTNTTIDFIPKFLIKDIIEKGDYLEFHAYQLFIKNYLNPNTRYSRLLIKWETGLGKTIGALSIALNFINYYQKQEEYLSEEISLGSVFILGFTQQIFRDELFKYPEFGFISREELANLKQIKKQAYMGNLADIEHLKKFNTMLKKRLQNRKGNGFFVFIGYKELTNHLFIRNEDDKINLQSIEDQELLNMIEKGDIKINKELLETFANSLLICDEVHNIYNSSEKNNWGVAIQTILNYHKSCRAVFLSATPINNSPTESIDLLNLLLPRQHYKMLHKKDFFTKDEDLLPNKEKELANYFRGRVSYIRNRNPQNMALKSFSGEKIKNIDYLKFIRCPMSKFHYKTYKDAIKDKETIGLEGIYLFDFAIPDPSEKNPFESMGLYKAKDLKEKLNSATQQWKNMTGIHYNSKKDIITGVALHRDNITTISSKYKKMIDMVIDSIKQKKGKIFIFHNNIHNSGTLFIQEILYQNGMIGEFDNSSDTTICSICGNMRKDHNKGQLISLINEDSKQDGEQNTSNIEQDHFYSPTRFVIVHSNLDKKRITQSLEKYNSIGNIDGSKFMILIGSKIIKESHSMNSVRQLYVMSRPDNISTLIQVIGRAVRLNSHKLLPKKDQNVTIFIFTSSIPGQDTLSFEEIRYKEKVDVYKVIQRIEKIMHENAIDIHFNYENIWKESDEDKNFDLTILPYNKPNIKSNFKLDELNLSTFNTFHAKEEVEYLMYMIKKLFIEFSSVWKYNDLFNAVLNPPFNTEINTSLISQSLFNIALNNLIYMESINYIEPKLQNLNNTLVYNNLLDKVRNPNDKIFIEQSGIPYILTQYGEYYIMAPIVNDEIPNNAEIIYRKYNNVKPYLMNIKDYLIYDMNTNYGEKKIKFIKKWENVSVNHLELAVCDYGIKFHQDFIEEVIEYVIKIWTDPDVKKIEYHNFYIKMLYYYDIQKLIAWAHTVNDNIRKKYKDYILPINTKLLNKKLEKEIEEYKKNKEESSGFVNLLISSINRDDPYWISTGMMQEYDNKILITNAIFDGLYRKSKTISKINADLLPVGHFLTKVPRFYIINEGWRDDPSYSLTDKTVKENSIIIGYDSRSKTGLTVKFKVRTPVQNIKQFKDNRMIEKGAICSTKSKTFLKDIAKKLDIDLGDTNMNVDFLCQQIRSKLIYNELKSRMSNKPLRWHYFVYEAQDL